LSLSSLRGRSITSYQFDVEYDPAVVNPATVAADLSGTICDGFGLAANSPEPGRLKVVVFGVAPVSSDGVYVNLRFVPTGPVGSSSALTISGFRFDDASDPVRINNGLIVVTPAVANEGTDNGDGNQHVTTGGSEVSSNLSIDLWNLSAIRPYALKGL
jgi:hypothetical protein